jgi:AcrR family transcriptional regulator
MSSAISSVAGASRQRAGRLSARERLLAAALAQFGADGPVAVSLDEVRQQAGVSVGALYHHFADKTALIDALFLELTEQVQAASLAELRAHPTAEDGVKAEVRLYLRWVSNNRGGARILLGHRPDAPALRELNRTFFNEVTAWWETHVHYGALRSLPRELLHALWLGPAQEYTRNWLAGHTKRVPRAVADILADAAWNTLKEP